jgi:hypothetical protein
MTTLAAIVLRCKPASRGRILWRRAGVGPRARTEGNETTCAPVLGLAGGRKEHDQQPMILEKPPGLETQTARIWTVTVDPAKG